MQWGLAAMTYVFYLIGWVAVIGGGAWGYFMVRAAGVLAAPVAGTAQGTSSLANLATLVAVAPSLSVIAAGLIFLAIAAVLARLDAIARYSRQNLRLLREMRAEAKE